MKRMYFLVAGLCLHFIGMAQTDTTGKTNPPQSENDTIRIGGMLIIKNRHHTNDSAYHGGNVNIQHTRRKPSNVSTNWLMVDLGFNNYTDNTNYASAATQQFAPGASSDWFRLKNGKSINVNLWLFMQRVNLAGNVANLQYGLGLELNNYRYQENIRFRENPTSVYKDVIHYTKNKLAADYITVPVMLNLIFNPNKEKYKTFGVSAGMSAGYRYASRQKFVSGETGKQKTRDDFNLRPFKISYIGEVQLGAIKLYGSLATQSIFEKGLDQTPYCIGLRLSNW